MFALIYGDTPPHGVDGVIMPFPCSAISPQRSLCPQYDRSAVDDDDGISSQWSMSPEMEPHLNNARNTLADVDYCKCFRNGVLVNNNERTTVAEAKHIGLPPVVTRRNSFLRPTFSHQQQQQLQCPAG